MKIEYLVNALFKGDNDLYYKYLNSRFKKKSKSLYRYVPIDKKELEDIDNQSIEEIRSILTKDYQYAVNALLDGYLYHNSPKFFNDPFDCVFGIGFNSLFRELMLQLVDRTNLKDMSVIEDDIPEGLSFENAEEIIANLDASHSVKTFLKTSIDIAKLMVKSGFDFNNNPDLAQKVFLQHLFSNPESLHGMLTPFISNKLTPEQFGQILLKGKDQYIDDEMPAIDLLHPNIEDFRRLAKSDKEKKDFENMEDKLIDMIQEINNRIFQLIDDKFGVIALTYLDNDPLMWSHYADSHRGMCIEYDFEEYLLETEDVKSLIFPIEYSKERVSIDENILDQVDIRDFDGKGKEDITKLFVRGLFTKNIAWKIEKEWRSITLLKNDSVDARKIETFKVKSVSFGNKMHPKIKEALAELLEDFDFNIFEMVNQLENYDIKREKYVFLPNN